MSFEKEEISYKNGLKGSLEEIASEEKQRSALTQAEGRNDMLLQLSHRNIPLNKELTPCHLYMRLRSVIGDRRRDLMPCNMSICGALITRSAIGIATIQRANAHAMELIAIH